MHRPSGTADSPAPAALPRASFPGWLRILAGLGLLVLAGCGWWGGGRWRQELQGANLLLVTVDTLRADALGCYGGTEVPTPHFDALAETGVRFADVTAPAPITLVSHATILTGLTPLRHGVRDNGQRLPEAIQTLARHLAAREVATGAVIGGFPLLKVFGLTSGFDHYDDRVAAVGRPLEENVARPAGAVTRAALDWLARQGDRRFFCWVHYFDPHEPYAPPPPHDQAPHPYHGEVAYTDQALGDLLAGVAALAPDRPTLVVVTADHGEGLGDHGEATHGALLYQTTMRVPLLVGAIGADLPARVVAEPVGLVDLMPTMLALLGEPVPPDLDGISLAPLLAGETLPERTYYLETYLAHFAYRWAPLRGVRAGDWKLIHGPDPELYELATDPDEQRRRGPGEAERVGRLGAMLTDWLATERAFEGTTAPLTARQRQALASLGYAAAGGRRPREGAPGPDPKTVLPLLESFQRAVALRSRGHFREGIAEAEPLLGQDPANPVFLHFLAESSLALEEPAAARGYYDRLLAADPDDGQALLGLGKVAEALGEPARALDLFHQAVARDPFLDTAPLMVGLHWLREGDLGKAERYLDQAVARNPLNLEARYHRAGIWLRRGEVPRAETAFRRLLATDPSFGLAQVGLGLAAWERGRPAAALAAFTGAWELGEQGAPVALQIARAARRTGNATLARRFYGEYLRRAPAPAPARAEAETFLAQGG